MAFRGRGLSRRNGGKSLETRPLSVSPSSPLVRHRAAHGSTGRTDARTAARGGSDGKGSRAHFLLSIVLRNKIGEITGAVRWLFFAACWVFEN